MYTTDIEKHSFHPSSVYSSPLELLEDTSLSRTKKLSMFNNWKTDVKQVLLAESEKNCVSIHEDICREELLEELNNCLDLLEQA